MFKKISKFFMRKTYIEPLCDSFRYTPIYDSFAGGSLARSNILVITNNDIDEEVVKNVFEKENCYLSLLCLDNEQLSCDTIKTSLLNFVGPVNCFINIVHINEDNYLINNNHFNETDSLRLLYAWLQKETDYLISFNIHATISSAVIKDESIDSNSIGASANAIIKGLARVLGNHGIIENGLVADANVQFEDVLHTLVYLSSKYGQVLVGEVLNMRSN